MDVIPKIDLILVLSGIAYLYNVDKTLLSYPLRAVLASADGNSNEKFKAKKIGSSVNFFRQGISSNKTLVCTVKSAALSSTIKVYEPMGLGVSNLHGKIGRMFGNSNDGLRPDKVFNFTEMLGFVYTERDEIYTLPDDKTLCWMFKGI